MSLLDFLWDLFRKPAPVQITTSVGIPGDEVRNILKSFGGQIWISDGGFKLVNDTDMITFLNSNPVNQRKYITEGHDCDDFSYELMGDVSSWNPDGSFGLVWGLNASGGGHAWNFYINQNKEIMFVEPQNDQIFRPTTEKIWLMVI